MKAIRTSVTLLCSQLSLLIVLRGVAYSQCPIQAVVIFSAPLLLYTQVGLYHPEAVFLVLHHQQIQQHQLEEVYSVLNNHNQQHKVVYLAKTLELKVAISSIKHL